MDWEVLEGVYDACHGEGSVKTGILKEAVRSRSLTEQTCMCWFGFGVWRVFAQSRAPDERATCAQQSAAATVPGVISPE